MDDQLRLDSDKSYSFTQINSNSIKKNLYVPQNSII